MKRMLLPALLAAPLLATRGGHVVYDGRGGNYHHSYGHGHDRSLEGRPAP